LFRRHVFEIKDTTHFSGKVTIENFGGETLEVTVDKKILKNKLHLLLVDGGVADWIKVKETNFVLKPGESKDVHFEMNVPSSYNYRDAVGALVINATPRITSQVKSGGAQLVIKQSAEVVVPIVVGLPGPIMEFVKFESFKAPFIVISPIGWELQVYSQEYW